MQGGGDPFNRGFFPWGNEDTELTEWYKKLGALRHSCPSLKEGQLIPYSAMLSCVAYKRVGDGEALFIIVNRNSHDIDYYLPDDFKGAPDILNGGCSCDFIKVNAFSAVILKKTEIY